MKRSHAPVFWLLFGAGGLISALLGPALVLLSGLALPLGWAPATSLFSFERMLGLARHGLGKAFVFALISLFAWHAAHRIFHSLHDLGLRSGFLAKGLCYGGALAVTLVAAACLLRIGF